MAWVATGMAVVGAYSSIKNNEAIADASYAQQVSNNKYTEQASGITQSNLQQLGIGVNEELGMALTKLAYQDNRQQSGAAIKRSETNVYGNLALRKEAVMDTKAALSKDTVMQQAEAKMVDVQEKMRSAKYDTEARYAGAQSSYNNSMSQQKSTLDIAIGAGTTYVSAGGTMPSGGGSTTASFDSINASNASFNNFGGQ